MSSKSDNTNMSNPGCSGGCPVWLNTALIVTVLNLLLAFVVTERYISLFQTNMTESTRLMALGEEFQNTNKRMTTFQSALRQVSFATQSNDALRSTFPELAMPKAGGPGPGPGVSVQTAPASPVKPIKK